MGAAKEGVNPMNTTIFKVVALAIGAATISFGIFVGFFLLLVSAAGA